MILERFRYFFLNEYKATVKQNSQGLWLVDNITVTANSEKTLMEKVDRVIGRANEILNKHNTPKDDKEQE